MFALYACAGRPGKQHDRAPRLLKLLTSGRDTSDDLLDHWSERIEAAGPEIVGSVLSPYARGVADDNANHDHASAFLHALLKELEQRQH
ncbi:hypothetical protein GGD67_005556 [Bradyrhizobium sp. IAR9]|nr:hypothetical protein [Bradyrhizobium sp. IAR9]